MIRCIRKKTTVYRNVVGSFMDEMSTYYSAVVCLVYDYNISRKAGTHTVLFFRSCVMLNALIYLYIRVPIPVQIHKDINLHMLKV